MNSVAFLVFFTAAMPAALAGTAETNPLSTALDLLDSLAAKVTAEAEAEAKAHQEYGAWCDETTSNMKFQIKTGDVKKEQLQALSGKASADIASSDENIEALAGSISTGDQEHQEASDVRAKEASEFSASETALVDAISSLDRAVMILQKEMQKNPAAFAQVDKSNMSNLLKTLSTVIDAASFPASDQKKLMALAQTAQADASEDEDLLAAPAYKTHSETIFDMLDDLKEKAEGQLAELRKGEASAKHNFLMLTQSLKDQIAADMADLKRAKAAKSSYQETESIADGDLAENSNALNDDKSTLYTAGTACRTAAADHEASVKSRNEELTALATASKILSQTSSGAASQTYSFLEMEDRSQARSTLHSHADLANAEIVSLLKKVAKENHSAALAQLASKIAATLRYGATAGQDPFSKVRELISDLLAKLQAQAQADITEKSFCDEELGKSGEKKNDLDTQMTKLLTKLDQASATSARLKAEVKAAQNALAKLARSQAEMDSLRTETRQEFSKTKADLELGLSGVRKAIAMLQEYYGSSDSSLSQDDFQISASSMQQPSSHVKSSGAGGGIVNQLEVVESDFARDLAVEETAEADAESDYQKMTQSNKDSKLLRESDVMYKTKEFKGLDKAATEVSGDKESTASELEAVLEYTAKLNERCVAKADAYETRKSRREAEIQGLKDALSIIEGQTAFVQRRKKRGLHSVFLGAM